LPEPIRTSAGFFVTGFVGNTRIQTFPPRLKWWTIARRAGLDLPRVIQHGSCA